MDGKPVWERSRGGNVNLYELCVTAERSIRALIDRKLLSYRQEAARTVSYAQEMYESLCGGCLYAPAEGTSSLSKKCCLFIHFILFSEKLGQNYNNAEIR